MKYNELLRCVDNVFFLVLRFPLSFSEFCMKKLLHILYTNSLLKLTGRHFYIVQAYCLPVCPVLVRFLLF